MPQNYCDVTGPWAFCDDYRSLGNTPFEAPFPSAINAVTLDCLDTGTPSYLPSMLGGTLPFPCAFSRYAHFMQRVESGGFGVSLLRFHQPVDLTAERHIHLDMDLKMDNTRNYTRIGLSPDLTKRDADDRGGQAYPRSFIQLWFQNGDVKGSICRQGACEGDSYPWGDAFSSTWMANPPTGDNIRRDIDIYVSQTSIRVYIEGVLRVNDTFAPLGFDAAYLYLSAVSYNPCKNGQCSFAAQTFHWDNVAWDGPTLAPNSLTPAGYRDVVFNAYGAASCAVNTIPAVAQTNGPVQGWTWTTWVARIVDDNAGLAIQCVPGQGWSLASQPIRAIEVVKQVE